MGQSVGQGYAIALHVQGGEWASYEDEQSLEAKVR